MRSTWVVAISAAVLAVAVTGAPGSAQAYGYGHGGGGYQAVRCQSRDYREAYCPVDTRGGVQISRQLSRTPCQLGHTWGYDRGGIWVDGGCSGEFVIGSDWSSAPGHGGYGQGYYGQGGAYPGYGHGGGYQGYGQGGGYRGHGQGYHRIIRCESRKYRQRWCHADVRYGVEIVRQLSHSPCHYGQSWGYDQRGIWVSNGCAAEFRVG